MTIFWQTISLSLMVVARPFLGVSYFLFSRDPDLWRTLCYGGAVVLSVAGLGTVWAASTLPATLVKNSSHYRGKKSPQEREKMLAAIFWIGAAALFAVAATSAVIARFVIPPPA